MGNIFVKNKSQSVIKPLEFKCAKCGISFQVLLSQLLHEKNCGSPRGSFNSITKTDGTTVYTKCSICAIEEQSVALQPCRHGSCGPCSTELRTCPICGNAITSIGSKL